MKSEKARAQVCLDSAESSELDGDLACDKQ